jgi:hypothetical protein
MDVAEGGFSIREKGLSMLLVVITLTAAYAISHGLLHGTRDVVIARGKPGIAWMCENDAGGGRAYPASRLSSSSK